MLKLKTVLTKLVMSHKLKQWHKIIVAFCVSVLAVIYFHPVFASGGSALLGVTYVYGAMNIPHMQAFESWQGKKNAIVNIFTNWCEQPNDIDYQFSQMMTLWNNHNVPMVSWEPMYCDNTKTPADIETRIANGDFDNYIYAWSDRMKVFLSGPDGQLYTGDDRRAYIRLAHEPNGVWYPWAPQYGVNPPEDYIRMWRRVKSIFHNRGMSWQHLQFVWCINATDVGGYVAEQFYPGDKYVDWVSISGYNWGATQPWFTWKHPDQAYDGIVNRLRAITKRPLSITEFATTSVTNPGNFNVPVKSQWIKDVFNYALSRNIKMVLWFNETKETDWSVFGGPYGDSYFDYGATNTRYNTYNSYKEAVSSPSFVPSNPSNPRLLTNDEFGGWF